MGFGIFGLKAFGFRLSGSGPSESEVKVGSPRSCLRGVWAFGFRVQGCLGFRVSGSFGGRGFNWGLGEFWV